jgi:hypothetical protein
MYRSGRFPRSAAVVAAAITGLVMSSATSASAAITPTSPEPGPAPVTSTPATLSSLPSSQWQTNAAVWALAVKNGHLFAGGEFTSVRPPGAAIGTGEVTANRLAMFNAATGAYDSSFKHSVNGRVLAVAISGDGKTLYAGGEFTAVDGKAHAKVAAFDLTKTGDPLLAWDPKVNGTVKAIATTPDSTGVVLGGGFTTMGGATRANIGMANAATGAVTSWNPSIDGVVDALMVAPGGQYLMVGGNFENANNVHHRALASIVLTTGANGPMTDMITSCGAGCSTRSDVKAFSTDGTNVFVGAEGTGGGWFDGTLALNPQTGAQVWKTNCLGATQAIAIVGGVLYDGSHAHDCSAVGGFGQAPFQSGPSSWHHLMGERADTGGLLDWFPTTNPGPTNAQDPNELGPRAMATDGTNLYVAGQFTTVNGAGQQGLTRLMANTPRSAPKAVTGASVSLTANGGAKLAFDTTSDTDSGALTYRVYRDGNATPVATMGPVLSHWWKPELLTFRDSGLAAGSHFYVIEAVDESGLATKSGRFTSSTAVSPGYAASVLAGAPAQFLKLNESSGTTAADSSGRARPGYYDGAMNQGVPGAVPSNAGVHLGSTGVVSTNAPAIAGPTTYSAEIWFRTTTTTGGRLFGFSNAQTGTSSSYDRHLYMTNSGQLIFGVYTGSVQYTFSPKSYNDGTWHHALVTQGSAGMVLYVDGVAVSSQSSVTSAQSFNGWWRVGSDNLNGWPYAPSSSGFNGDVDDFAVYNTALTANDAKAHLTAE